MADKTLHKRPVDQPPKSLEIRPRPALRPLPKRRPPRVTRWIDFAALIAIVAAAAVVAVLLLRGGEEAEELVFDVEAGSELAVGARHEPGFSVGFRWVGESDVTLEEFLAVRAAVLAPDEAASPLAVGRRHTDPDYGIGYRWVGASDLTLEEVMARWHASGIPDEAASPLTVGARHLDPDFSVGFRWVGESDFTLEELTT